MLSATLCLHLGKYDCHTAHDMQQNLYVDNLISGTPIEESAVQYFTEARKISLKPILTLGAGHPIVSSYALSHKVIDENDIVNVSGTPLRIDYVSFQRLLIHLTVLLLPNEVFYKILPECMSRWEFSPL